MRKINTAERKLKVLEAVVDSYILYGEPVGSKTICSMLDFEVSSATIRNDLAELSDLGYIIQPHTSAGRIPSPEGIRLYIDKIMKPNEIPNRQAEYIQDVLSDNGEEPGNILKHASELVSKITGYPVFAITPSGENTRILKIKVVEISRYSSMVVLITTSGVVRTKLYRCDFVITPEIVLVFEKILNEKLVGMPLRELTLSFIQTFASTLGQLALLMPNVIWAIFELSNEILENTVFVYGKTNLLSFGEYDIDSVKEITSLLENKNTLNSLADMVDDERIFLGNESNLEFLYDSAMVITRYKLQENTSGIIGIVGPNRLDYKSVLPIMKYITELVTEMINNLTSL